MADQADLPGAVILAAGFSRRFGGIKLCAELGGAAGHATVFGRTLAAIRTALPRYKVITRPELAELLRPMEPELHIFEQAGQGMGATLAHAISLAGDWPGCLVCLADMPFIRADTYRRLARRLERGNIVIPEYRGQAGNPVGFGSAFYPELARLGGDRGGKAVIAANPAAVLRAPVDDAAILHDVNTPADLEKYRAGFS